MVRPSLHWAAQVGRAATPAAEAFTEDPHGKTVRFFYEIARHIPYIIETFKVQELITVPALRRIIAQKFRANAHVTNPKVIDLLIYKGREELEMALLQHKQRHHLITEYISNRFFDARKQKAKKLSPFLEEFYGSEGQ